MWEPRFRRRPHHPKKILYRPYKALRDYWYLRFLATKHTIKSTNSTKTEVAEPEYPYYGLGRNAPCTWEIYININPPFAMTLDGDVIRISLHSGDLEICWEGEGRKMDSACLHAAGVLRYDRLLISRLEEGNSCWTNSYDPMMQLATHS